MKIEIKDAMYHDREDGRYQGDPNHASFPLKICLGKGSKEKTEERDKQTDADCAGFDHEFEIVIVSMVKDTLDRSRVIEVEDIDKCAQP